MRYFFGMGRDKILATVINFCVCWNPYAHLILWAFESIRFFSPHSTFSLLSSSTMQSLSAKVLSVCCVYGGDASGNES